MIRLLLLSLLLSTFVQADKVRVKSLACKTMDALRKAPVDKEGYLNLNMYAIANDCVVLTKNTEVQVLGYDPRNIQSMYVQITEKRTGYNYFVLKSKIQIEQGGKKANYRF